MQAKSCQENLDSRLFPLRRDGASAKETRIHVRYERHYCDLWHKYSPCQELSVKADLGFSQWVKVAAL
jgi:hypothetical protein